MHYKHYNHMHVPDSWEQYWSKYPNGYTVLEALMDWLGQVNEMTDSFNHLSDDYTVLNRNMTALEKELRMSWNAYKESTTNTYTTFRDEVYTIINNWIATIEPTIQDEVVKKLNTWLDDGTLAAIINNDVFNMKANQTDLDAMKKRDFKPLVIETPYLFNDQTTQFTKQNVDVSIKSSVDAELDGMCVVLHIGHAISTPPISGYSRYDSNTGLYVAETWEVIEYLLQESKVKGLKISSIKIHQMTANYFTENGFVNYFSYLNDLLTDVFTLIDSYDVGIISAINEAPYIYGVESNKDAILLILNKIKQKGYKATITTAGWEDFSTRTLPSIKESISVICVNEYFSVGTKGIDVTQDEFDFAIKQSSEYHAWAYKKYKKRIIVSEYGCTDWSDNLMQTGEWNLYGVKTKGANFKKYIMAMFDSYDNGYVDEIWMWYNMVNDSSTHELLKTRGGI